MGPKWGSDVARNGLLSFVHGAPLVPSAQAMPPADGFEGPEARGYFGGCASCGVAGFALKSGCLIEDMWEMIAHTPPAGAPSLPAALDGTHGT